MTEMLARDGEGAEHLIRATVRGAENDDDARRVAKSLVNSPLVKTMVHGADPNVGRLLMAVGKCFDVMLDPTTTDAWINGHAVVRGGGVSTSTTTLCAPRSPPKTSSSTWRSARERVGDRVRLRPHQGLRRGERGVLLELTISRGSGG